MESVRSAASIPFRSKKPVLRATPKKSVKLSSEDKPAMLETPEKSSRPPRVRNNNMALSVADVKRTAQMLRKRDLNRSDLNSDSLGSARSDSRSLLPVVEKHQKSALKRQEGSSKLPEKFQMLCEFFNVIVSVIPLLKMRRKSSTFTNICPKIQSMTDRRFTIKHLAQLKYILPEAILVKRIHVRDERTDCMKEELLITLDMEAVKASKNVQDIRQIFQARIEDYLESHTEESDVPEGELPALFHQLSQNEASTIDKKNSSTATASSIPQSFQRRFSQGVSSEKSENQTSCLSESSPQLDVLATPIEVSSTKVAVDIQGTPLKEAVTPARLMTRTPAIKPSKRCYMSPDDDTCDVPTKLVRRPTRSLKCLKFDPAEDSDMAEVKIDDASGLNVDSDILDIVPKNLLLSIREKEKKMLEEQDPAISQARRRHQLMAGVPKLLDMIHLIFLSINRSVITKEELLYKIISSHCDIVDRGEIEEQFKLLQELAPEYISERSCSSGDTLIRLNKSVSVELVRAKLVES